MNQPFLIILALLALIVVVSYAAMRQRRELARRVCRVVLPTAKFAPTTDEVIRSMAHWRTLRRPVAGVFLRPCEHVRIRHTSVNGGQFVTTVDVPRWGEEVLASSQLDESELLTEAEFGLRRETGALE